MRKRLAIGLLAIAIATTWFVASRTADDSLPTETPEPPAPKASPAAYTLRGRVLSADGEPLAGVPVRARILTPGVAFAAVPVTTDKQGRFLLRIFPPRDLWEVRAHPDDQPAFGAEVRPSPGDRGEVTLRAPAEPTARPKPSVLAGTVVDRGGRLLTGEPIVVVTKEGERLASAVTGDEGRFSVTLDATPPFVVRLEAEGERDESEVFVVPAQELHLVKWGEKPETAELRIEFDIPQSVNVRSLYVEAWDSTGARRFRNLHHLRNQMFVSSLYFDVLDIRVSAEGYAGTLQAFDFRPGHQTAVIRLEPAARIRGQLPTPADVALISRSPTVVSMGPEAWEGIGTKGRIPGLVRRTEGSTTEFDFDKIPSGDYILRIHGRGLETREQRIFLAPGEVLDLGPLPLVEAPGKLWVRVTDGPDELRHSYRIRVYNHQGLTFAKKLTADGGHEILFDGLAPGRWWYRAERFNEHGGTGYAGWDQPVEISQEKETRVAVDAWYPWEREKEK